MKYSNSKLPLFLVLLTMFSCSSGNPMETNTPPLIEADSCETVSVPDSANSDCDTITFDTIGKDVILPGD